MFKDKSYGKVNRAGKGGCRGGAAAYSRVVSVSCMENGASERLPVGWPKVSAVTWVSGAGFWNWLVGGRPVRAP